jgi:hypothetical protein
VGKVARKTSKKTLKNDKKSWLFDTFFVSLKEKISYEKPFKLPSHVTFN